MLFGNNLYSLFHYNKLAQEKLKQLELKSYEILLDKYGN
jgi:hypothetical protein